MVYEQRSEVIIMLTRTIEAGSIRKVWAPGLLCAPYKALEQCVMQ